MSLKTVCGQLVLMTAGPVQQLGRQKCRSFFVMTKTARAEIRCDGPRFGQQHFSGSWR